jgi:membrane associated rhomboid family serine protease
MRYTSRTPGYIRTYESFPSGVKWLLIANIALFVIYYLAANQTRLGSAFNPFWLVPRQILDSFTIWQFFTYLFLHDPHGFSHILFNMLALWMFGAELERQWGRKEFLKYYFICGVGAGLCVFFADWFFTGLTTRTIGASGAVYGLLLAFGVLFADRTVLYNFLFPMKAKYMVMIIGAIVFLSSLGAASNGVSHVAHLGGMVIGYVYIKRGSKMRIRIDFIESLNRRYQRWKIERAKRKFQVYLKKHQ